MATRTSLVVGDFLVWQGQGLVRVEGSEDRPQRLRKLTRGCS